MLLLHQFVRTQQLSMLHCSYQYGLCKLEHTIFLQLLIRTELLSSISRNIIEELDLIVMDQRCLLLDNQVYEYNLTTSFDISTATLTGNAERFYENGIYDVHYWYNMDTI